MEKIRIYHFRLIKLSALIFALVQPALWSQEAKTVEVEVAVPVQKDDMAAAKADAQKMAFEKALDQVLPATMDPSLRTEKLKHAIRSIKGFRVIEEKLEGDTLKQKFACEVILEAEATPLPSTSSIAVPLADSNVTFEVAWIPDQVQFNAVDLLKYVSDVMGTPAASVRIGRGNVTLTIALKKSLEETQTQLASFVGRRGLVKMIRRDENRPPDVIPTPIPMQADIPSSTPNLSPTPTPMPASPIAMPSTATPSMAPTPPSASPPSRPWDPTPLPPPKIQ